MADAFATQHRTRALETASEFLSSTSLTSGLNGQPTNPPLNLLVVDDDEHIREVCRSVAIETGMKVSDVGTAEEALELLELTSVDVLLTDLRLPGTSGLELLKRVVVTHPDIAVVMLTQYGTIDSAVQATRMGAADYVTKPFRVEELRARLEQVVHAVELKRENRLLREQVRTRPGFGGLIGMSPRMDRVYKMIEKVAQREHPVLVLGESGTGKELVARSIHYMGLRKDKPFVPVECSALVPLRCWKSGTVWLHARCVHRCDASEAGVDGIGQWRNPFSGRDRGNVLKNAGQAFARAETERSEAGRIRPRGGQSMCGLLPPQIGTWSRPSRTNRFAKTCIFG